MEKIGEINLDLSSNPLIITNNDSYYILKRKIFMSQQLVIMNLLNMITILTSNLSIRKQYPNEG